MAKSGLPDLVVGAGSVLLPEQVGRAVDADAQFVISPGLSAAVIQQRPRLGIATLPGVATGSELMSAKALFDPELLRMKNGPEVIVRTRGALDRARDALASRP